MVRSYSEMARAFKSPWLVSIAWLLKSRDRIRAKAAQLALRCDELERQNQELLQRNRQLSENAVQTDKRVALLQEQLEQARASVNLPADPPVGTHGYGPIMIALAVNLGMSIGFRGAERAIRIFYDAFGLRGEITPSHDSIRNWSKRLGVALMQEAREQILAAKTRIIMVDHSIQIGDEKLMVVLGLDADKLPKQGQALRREDMCVLEIKAAKQWKTEDMVREYKAIDERYGAIRQIIIDGASELQKGAKSYAESVDHDVAIQGDAAHYAATQVKSILGKDEKFQEAIAQMGTTRAQVQQTELGFVSPPTPKNKARFMNLSSIIGWMSMMLWLLRNPEAECLVNVDPERLQAKFGWIENYADQIAIWDECQNVISTFVKFSNEQYLHHGASSKVAHAIGDLQYGQSRDLRDRLVKFIAESETTLKPGERLPMSTQILESLFGQYKQIEGQQSKSGFTGLVSCIPLMLCKPTPSMVRESFPKVSMKQMNTWVTDNIGSTLTSKRRAAYAQHRKSTKRARSQLVLT